MTALAPQLVARLAALGVLGVVVQTAAVSQLPIAGANADLSPLLVMAVGLLCGSLAGGCFGFGVGLFADVVSLQTLGVSSLVLLSAGYLAGRYREGFDISNPLIPLALAGSLTLLSAGGFALVQLMLGVEAPVSLLVLRELFLQYVYGAVLMIPAYPLVRRLLRAALVEEPPRGRIPIPFRTA